MCSFALRCITAVSIAGCGDGSGGGGSASPGSIRTLAYVVSECHEDASTSVLSQSLRVQRGDLPPITVATVPAIDLPPVGLCALFGDYRSGTNSVYAGAFQRLATSPDGSAVVFELTFDFSILAELGVPNPLTPDQEGIFYVRADGTGLRRMGPASREAAQRLGGLPTVDQAFPAYAIPSFSFNPSGTVVALTERGPGPDGEEAPQIALIDIDTGDRELLTSLPDAPPDPADPALPATFPPLFIDDQTLEFVSRTNADGLNPQNDGRLFTVNADGSVLAVVPPPVSLPDSHVVPTFSIIGALTSANVFSLSLPGTPVNPNPFNPSWGILEIFAISGDDVLQLTNYRRVDTGAYVTSDRGRVYFTASVDPQGGNPSENCQVFWVDSLGGDPHQLTSFSAAQHSTIGCLPIPQSQGEGCGIHAGPVLDPETRTLVFTSTCDPLGTNPNGEQLFAMRADGAAPPRQLTSLRGIVQSADGSLDVELPGPCAYSVLGGSLS